MAAVEVFGGLPEMARVSRAVCGYSWWIALLECLEILRTDTCLYCRALETVCVCVCAACALGHIWLPWGRVRCYG